MKHNTFLNLSISMILAYLTLLVVGLWGWVLNIIALTHMATVMTGEGAVRIAGIFIAPLGSILGFFF